MPAKACLEMSQREQNSQAQIDFFMYEGTPRKPPNLSPKMAPARQPVWFSRSINQTSRTANSRNER